MYTIALLAQKGGTGKTTLAVHVAADFEGAGGSAALVDLDPQASAALWGDRRGRSPFVGAVPAARLEAALAAARLSGAGLAVIDTAPHSESAARPDDGSRRGRRARLRGRGRSGPHRGACRLRALPAPGPVRGGGVPPQQGGWRDPRLRSVAAPPHGRPKCLRLTTPSPTCSRPPTARQPPPPRPTRHRGPGSVTIAGHFSPAVHRQLRLLGVMQDRTVQSLLGEALNELFRKHGKLPIARE